MLFSYLIAFALLMSRAMPTQQGTLPDQRVWNLAESSAKFLESFDKLTERAKAGPLDWDKDDELSLGKRATISNNTQKQTTEKN